MNETQNRIDKTEKLMQEVNALSRIIRKIPFECRLYARRCGAYISTWPENPVVNNGVSDLGLAFEIHPIIDEGGWITYETIVSHKYASVKYLDHENTVFTEKQLLEMFERYRKEFDEFVGDGKYERGSYTGDKPGEK